MREQQILAIILTVIGMTSLLTIALLSDNPEYGKSDSSYEVVESESEYSQSPSIRLIERSDVQGLKIGLIQVDGHEYIVTTNGNAMTHSEGCSNINHTKERMDN